MPDSPHYDITLAHEGGDTLVEHVERLTDDTTLELVRGKDNVVAIVITPEAHRRLLAAVDAP